MKLKSVEINGFKSFVDPVVADFADGITAVVGPNGCGKSNLSEAITWVLGEQSAKSLRGGRMEDVIFSGTEQRRSLGMAEVNITLVADPDHEESRPGSRPGEAEIVIGRRVFRGGEGQYRMNDKLVRLKEIKDLLADTGLGVRAYSVIEQGRIGQILSTKPQERRRLIEEAAGITRYKQRKRLAELKLEEATANQMRLDDILSEVDRARRSLKRQSNAARLFKEREAKYKELLNLVLRARWSRMAQELDELKTGLASTTDRDAELAAEVSRVEAELAERREELEQLNEAMAALSAESADHRATIEGRQEFLKGATRTIEELAERLANGKTIDGQRHDELASFRQLRLDLDQTRQEIEAEHDGAKASFDADQHRVRRADEALAAAEAKVNEQRAEVEKAEQAADEVKERLQKLTIEIEKTAYRKGHLVAEIEAKVKALTAAGSDLEQAGERVTKLATEIETKAAERDGVKAELETLLRQEAESTQRKKKHEDERLALLQRQELLQELAQAQEERRRALVEALIELGIEEPRFLQDEVQVPAGWEECLDLYLESLRDAVLLPERHNPRELVQKLAAKGCDATLLQPAGLDGHEPLAWLQRPRSNRSSTDHSEGHKNGDARRSLWQTLLAPFRRKLEERDEHQDDVEPADLAAITASLGDALGLPSQYTRSLPPAFLVADSEAAERLARLYPGVAFLSPEPLWVQNGVFHAQSQEAAPGALSRNREMDSIAEEIPTFDRLLEKLSEEIATLVTGRTESAASINRFETEIGERKQEHAVAQARRQDALHRRDRTQGEHERLLSELEEIEQELKVLAERRSGLQAEIETAHAESRRLESELDTANASLAEARQHREKARTESAGREGQLRLVLQRLESHAGEVRRLEQRSLETQGLISRWEQEQASLARRSEELEAAMGVAQKELHTALEAQAGMDERQNAHRAKLGDCRQLVHEQEKQVATARQQRDEHRQQIENLRVAQASKEQDASHLQTRYREHFDAELPRALDQLDEVPENLQELQEELAMGKEKLDGMGPVNVLAAEEYAEQEERHGFLSAQREDVQRSITSLRTTIREINATSQERFEKTFHQVNEAFGETFSELFRGGEASMRLLDEEDVLESGIEIVARPPGKRLQNIQLLSGGEKALTAIALLFALFRTKPSPFCILDEVDAPLDDANTLRFLDLLKRMSSDTQFVIITHNKLTMEVASALYGVTMEEKGVSKLVGVNVDELHPVAKTA